MADEYQRCFVALQVEKAAKGELSALIRKLSRQFGDQVRWMDPEQLHLTLRFIGNLDSQELLEVCAQLRRVRSGVTHVSAPLSGLGVFPEAGPPRVVWAGIDDGAGEVGTIHKQLNESLEGIGFVSEKRAYNPHITLGRALNHTDVPELLRALEQHGDTLSQILEAGSMGLYASQKSVRNVQYACLDRIALQ
ncbi:MAG: hypothetical protein Aurels2KO_20640 [Aureliella sp.]